MGLNVYNPRQTDESTPTGPSGLATFLALIMMTIVCSIPGYYLGRWTQTTLVEAHYKSCESACEMVLKKAAPPTTPEKK